MLAPPRPVTWPQSSAQGKKKQEPTKIVSSTDKVGHAGRRDVSVNIASEVDQHHGPFLIRTPF